MKGETSLMFDGAQIDEIARRYRKGETVEALAKAFQCSTAPIRNALRMRGVTMRLGGRAGPAGSRLRGWRIS